MSRPLTPQASDPVRRSSRRRVMRTAGLAALATGGAATFVACSADAPAAPISSAPASAAESSSSAPSPSDESTTAEKSTAPAPSGPSVATAKVPVGGGVILQDADYVVTQPTKGQFKAFSKICTHKGCPVAEVAGGTINCNCHGSKYSIKDGSVVNPPATQPLKEAKVTVASGKAVITS